jgi:hypothetical protein
MVAALIMGAALRPRPVFVKMQQRHSPMRLRIGDAPLGADPESRDSGFDAARRPGMTK